MKFEVALNPRDVQCKLVEQVVHEIESIHLALPGGQVAHE